MTDEGSKKIFFRSTNIEESILNSAKLISIGASFLNTTIQHQNIGKSDAESSSDTDSFEMISEKDV